MNILLSIEFLITAIIIACFVYVWRRGKKDDQLEDDYGKLLEEWLGIDDD